MIQANLLTIAIFAACVTAKCREGRTVISYIAKFDDANAGLLADLPVRGVTPLGPYDSLYYSNLGVIADDTTGVGVEPVSAPNTLAYDAVAEVQGPQNITSRYVDSITDYFKFTSFYFGCLVDTQESGASVPTSCTISLTGYRNGAEVAAQEASFTADATVEKMKFIRLNRGFSKVDTVAFKTVGVVGEAVEAVIFDNLAYRVVLLPGY